jgi:hypothetical protein
MSVSIEDILLMKAQQDAQANENEAGLTTALGALVGGAGGVKASLIENRGAQKRINKADSLAAAQGFSRSGAGKLKDTLRPGTRMATTALLTTLLGGALGRGAQQAFLNDSPAAEYLAKMQTGELNAQERYELENILGDTYKSIIGA